MDRCDSRMLQSGEMWRGQKIRWLARKKELRRVKPTFRHGSGSVASDPLVMSDFLSVCGEWQNKGTRLLSHLSSLTTVHTLNNENSSCYVYP